MEKDVLINPEKSLNSENDQYIEETPTSTSIYDFGKNNLHTYYLKKFKNELEQSRLGPLLMAPFLCSFSASMVHSSSIERKGKVALFLASDEGGKSTAVGLANEGTILCDDQNIVKKEEDGYYVHSTPWGMTINKRRGRIGGFFILEKAEKFELIRAKPDLLLSYLWNEHFCYHLFLPIKYIQRQFRYLCDLSRFAPVYRLCFPKNFIDWDAIDRAMKV